MTDYIKFSPQMLDDIRARVPVSREVGKRVKLTRSGREFVGLCPYHNERTPSFTVNDEKGFYHCFGCGAHGDVIRFLIEHENLPFPEAVRRLAEGSGIRIEDEPATSARAMDQKVPAPDHSPYVSSAEVGAWAWRAAVPAEGEIAERWFEYREIDPGIPLVRRAIRRFRYHPAMPFFPWQRHERPGTGRLCFPALLLPIVRIAGPRGDRQPAMIGVHCTYLRGDGRGKASTPLARPNGDGVRVPLPARKVWGSVAGGAVWLSAVDGLDRACEPHEPRPPLVAGEGLESTLAAMLQQPGDCRGAAALNLNNLQGGMKKGPLGEITLFNIEPDPDRRGFGIENPGAVIVPVDADMKALRTVRDGALVGPKVRERRGGPVTVREISGAERADICAALAVKNWRALGGHPVEAIRPRAGCDFNDQMMGAR